MKALKALTMSVSIFRGQISWCFSLSENNISPAAPDLELILFPLWYWPIMNIHTKQQDKVFETDFIDSQKSDPTFAHLLALSHIWVWEVLSCVFDCPEIPCVGDGTLKSDYWVYWSCGACHIWPGCCLNEFFDWLNDTLWQVTDPCGWLTAWCLVDWPLIIGWLTCVHQHLPGD